MLRLETKAQLLLGPIVLVYSGRKRQAYLVLAITSLSFLGPHPSFELEIVEDFSS